MKLSTRGRYGTRLLLELATHKDGKPVLLKDIAKHQEISLPYLEHIVAPLVAAGIVRSTRGVHGGVWLARPPRDIRVGDVVRLLDGPTAPVDCVVAPDSCHRSSTCVTHDLWCELRDAIDKVMDAVTLEDLAARQAKKEEGRRPAYQI